MSEENSSEQVEPAELTLEDLFQESVNEEEVKKAQAEMLLKQGTWTTTPPFTITKIGKDKNNRPFARFFGSITLGEEIGKIGVGMSWVHKFAKDKDGNETEKPDRSYKNYVMAHNAYKAAYGQEATSVGDVLKYVQDYPVRLRVIQTSDGENMVVAISAVRG